jgi:outer membrane protein assembly factor BamB
MVLQGTPPLRATAAGSDEATSYRIDAVHSGAQPGDTLATPLTQRWSVNLGGSVSYPLIAGGRVFVSVADSPNYGSRLYALDATTGATLWGPVELGGTYWFADQAYDNGRVFTIDFDGLLRAFDAGTGTLDWSVKLPTSTPSARRRRR